MTTLYGGETHGPNDEFKPVDGEALTADMFNYATSFWVADDVPDETEGKDGDVVFVIGDSPVGGELPGIGGWAEITDVSGSPKRYAYPEGGTDWVAFEWTDTTDPSPNGFKTLNGGIVDALLVGGGGGAGTFGAASTYMGYGGAGGVNHGAVFVEIENDVQVGQGHTSYGTGGIATHSVLSDAVAMSGGGGVNDDRNTYKGGDGGCGGGGATNATVAQGVQGGAGGLGTRAAGGGAGGTANGTTAGPGIELAYTSATPQTYAVGGSSSTPNTPNSGNGYGGSMPTTNRYAGSSGVVIVRVPAANAAKVPSDSWVTRSNHFAVVENGVVTETYTEHHYGNGTVTPLPQTDLIPCDANVTEGYAYENGEFVAPVPEIPAEQQEIFDRINELQQELRSYDG